ncbi:MAG: PIN domain-containing protein, partial [Candidatus Paceibacteria bacterium]
MSANNTFLIIDAQSLIHRAYHALPSLQDEKGRPVQAAYGFLLMLFGAVKEFNPQYIVAAFDLPSPTFRHEEFKDYKAHRPRTPPDLSSQIPLVKELLSAFNIPFKEQAGFEADDIIGTIAREIYKKNSNQECIILSGDLDVLQ